MATLLDFEKPIAELEGKVKELRLLADGSELDLAEEITQAREPGRQAAGADLRQAQRRGRRRRSRATPTGRTSRTMSRA